MASFDSPKINNPILSDVASINALLVALAKLDPSTQQGIQNGMIRLQEGGEGYVFEKFNGTRWERMEQFNLDAQSVDGKSASATVQADTIPVRDKDGKLTGDITGNAATATSAKALSEVNPVDKGGTGAATAEGARQNLGVPPTNHASSATTYGLATGDKYGHVKLSDATNGTENNTGGTAATPAAVKAAMDKANTAQTNLSKYLPLAGGTMTGEMKYKKATSTFQDFTETSTDIAGTPNSNQWYSFRMLSSDSKVVGMLQIGRTPTNQSVAQLVAYDVAGQVTGGTTKSAVIQAVAPKAGTPYAEAPTPPDNSNDTKIATTAWVKKQITANPSMPVGSMYIQMGTTWKTPQELFGGTWSDVSASYSGRFFRVVGGASAAFGENQAGGAPNITGSVSMVGSRVTNATGAFYYIDTSSNSYGGSSSKGNFGFSAQSSNSLYGAATEIRPINHTVRIWKRTA